MPERRNGVAIRHARGLAVGTLVLVLAACGASTAGSDRIVTGSDSPERLLQAWSGFPVNASPRPLVLIGSHVVGPSRFPNDEMKIAFLSGRFDLQAQLPSGPASAQGFPISSAAAALAMLRSSKLAPTTPASGSSTRGLEITAVSLGSRSFMTDRGDQSLPAWLFTLAGVDGPAGVLAVAPSAQWSPPGLPHPDSGAALVNGGTIGSDRRTLTAWFTGGPAGTGPCTASYDLRLTESATAVVVTLVEHYHSSAGTVCDLVGHERNASAILSRPLGARAVLDAVSGQPIPITG